MPDPASRIALGIDIGGTRVRVGIVDEGGTVLARVESRLPPEGEPAPLQEALRRHCREVTQQAGGEFAAVGVALPGVWDRQTGIMQRAVNLPRLEGVNIPQFFAEAVGRPVLIEVDANAVAWGQLRRLAPQPRRLVFMSIGTGVGGAVILNGEIVRHTRGGAGHFGFLIVDTSPGAPAGRNEVPGCLSALVAGPSLHLVATGSEDLQAVGDEPLPEAVLTRAGRALAVGFMQLVHIYAPDAIALGGGVIDHHPELVEHAQRSFGEFRSSLIPPDLRIVRAPLPTTEAGVAGAALLALADA